MAEWRVGRKLGKTIFRDDVVVGYIEDPELAKDLVDAVNLREQYIDQLAQLARVELPGAESGRERSLVPPRDHIAGVTGCDCSMCRAAEGGRERSHDPAVCTCQICQSGEGAYEARCPTCEQLVTVVRGVYQPHFRDPEDLRSRWCASSNMDAS